ncbi:MAG: hypothetical protein IJR31_00170 [Lachnospiraceae bacterium]|nr:hypothetical protein [Lachnospiraceae bacterium]
MGTDEEVLPEPFSEKNIDGTPLWGASNGGSLFRATSTDLDRRRGDRREGERRNRPYTPGQSAGSVPAAGAARSYQAPPAGEHNIYSAEAARHEALRASSMSSSGGYGKAESYATEPVQAHVSPAPSPAPAYTETAPSPALKPQIQDAVPQETAYVTASVKPVPDDYNAASNDRDKDTSDYGYGFEPPVDEKPGMIPNPMKMPPVKVKSSLDYDYDYDTDIGADDGYDYDYNDEAPFSASDTPSSDSFGFGGGDSDYGSSDIGADDDYGMDIDIDDDDDYR